MAESHKRPTLPKIYKRFLSECVAIMNAESDCRDIKINGDCVWGVFDTPKISNVDNVILVAAKLNSMVQILNYKLRKKSYSKMQVGIGGDYGKTLMVKAGYSGSGLNDIIWMGDVVNSACHICGKAGRNGREPLVVLCCIYNNLNGHNKGLLKQFTDTSDWNTYYEGNIVNTVMEDWYKENCK